MNAAGIDELRPRPRRPTAATGRGPMARPGRFAPWCLAGVLSGLVLWRACWLAAGVPDTTDRSDRVRQMLLALEQQVLGPDPDLPENQFLVLFESPDIDPSRGGDESTPHQVDTNSPAWAASLGQLAPPLATLAGRLPGLGVHVTAIEVWDEEAPVWITPGQDDAPGWRDWDDDGNGVLDDPSELGAAWSDDRCMTAHDPDFDASPPGRILDRGAYEPIEAAELSADVLPDRIQWVLRVR